MIDRIAVLTVLLVLAGACTPPDPEAVAEAMVNDAIAALAVGDADTATLALDERRFRDHEGRDAQAFRLWLRAVLKESGPLQVTPSTMAFELLGSQVKLAVPVQVRAQGQARAVTVVAFLSRTPYPWPFGRFGLWQVTELSLAQSETGGRRGVGTR